VIDDGTVTVEIIKGNNSFLVSGPGFQEEQVQLAPDPGGLLDPPVTTIWNTTAFSWGARWGGFRVEKRQLVLPFNIFGDSPEEWAEAETAFRSSWAFTSDTIIRVTSESGVRELTVRLSESPEQKMTKDPRINCSSLMTITCVAPWPFWTQPDVTVEWTLQSGTSGSDLFPPISNPTDVPMYLKYSLDENATWTLPDFSFGSDEWDRAEEDAARTVQFPHQGPGQGATVDSDPTEETLMTDDGSQLWAQLKSDLLYPVPPGTRNVRLPISVTNAQAGVSVQMRCERNWLRPWGLGAW
jgi:hypothetical protein